jgi:hypothetical protein
VSYCIFEVEPSSIQTTSSPPPSSPLSLLFAHRSDPSTLSISSPLSTTSASRELDKELHKGGEIISRLLGDEEDPFFNMRSVPANEDDCMQSPTPTRKRKSENIPRQNEQGKRSRLASASSGRQGSTIIEVVIEKRMTSPYSSSSPWTLNALPSRDLFISSPTRQRDSDQIDEEENDSDDEVVLLPTKRAKKVETNSLSLLSSSPKHQNDRSSSPSRRHQTPMERWMNYTEEIFL